MPITLDHVAVATREPEKLKRVLMLLGLADAGSEAVPSQGVLTHFLRASTGDSCIEILEVTDPKGTVEKFIAKKGPGIHHVSFRVASLDALCKKLRENGIRLTYEAPQLGAHEMRVNFIHPESTGGVLIEISEITAKHA